MFTDQEAETCFAVGDRNGDNEVSMEEFVDLLSSSHASASGPVRKFFEYCGIYCYGYYPFLSWIDEYCFIILLYVLGCRDSIKHIFKELVR